jgi:hypothetical protein
VLNVKKWFREHCLQREWAQPPWQGQCYTCIKRMAAVPRSEVRFSGPTETKHGARWFSVREGAAEENSGE